MAKKKKAKGLTPEARARSLVSIRRHDLQSAVTYTLPVNDGFEDEEINRGGGVDYPEAPEIDMAERAIVAVFRGEIGSLRAWVDWASGLVGGGLPKLAAALLGMSKPDYKDAAFRREHRKLQEYRQSKYGSGGFSRLRKDRQQRIMQLNDRLLREGSLHLKVLGDWLYESGRGGKPQERPFLWEKEIHSSESLSVIESGGNGFCETVRAEAERLAHSIVELQRVYALQIEYLKEV